jgi:hypothetical protein
MVQPANGFLSQSHLCAFLTHIYFFLQFWGLNSGLRVCWQAFYNLSHAPSPSNSHLIISYFPYFSDQGVYVLLCGWVYLIAFMLQNFKCCIKNITCNFSFEEWNVSVFIVLRDRDLFGIWKTSILLKLSNIQAKNSQTLPSWGMYFDSPKFHSIFRSESDYGCDNMRSEGLELRSDLSWLIGLTTNY